MAYVKKLLSTFEAAESLGVHDQTIRRWITDGKLNAIILPSGRKKIPIEEIDKILSQSTKLKK